MKSKDRSANGACGNLNNDLQHDPASLNIAVQRNRTLRIVSAIELRTSMKYPIRISRQPQINNQSAPGDTNNQSRPDQCSDMKPATQHPMEINPEARPKPRPQAFKTARRPRNDQSKEQSSHFGVPSHIIDAAMAIALKRRETLLALRGALERGEISEALTFARIICGLPTNT